MSMSSVSKQKLARFSAVMFPHGLHTWSIGLRFCHEFAVRLHYAFISLSLPPQISFLLQSWWRSVDWHGLWWLVLWPPSASWQQLSFSVPWLPALSTSSGGENSRGKEVRGNLLYLIYIFNFPHSLSQS